MTVSPAVLGLNAACIGKRNVHDFSTDMASRRDATDLALPGLNAGQVQGRVAKVSHL
ncbi:hypothetical protein [Caldimonas brevitalea]|uniref:Uncharacterized protein n=1 Tax=Caldimonas brevitalea TaxID=413882 RepID=A0A0G3BR88_9BURK|nr:hypothetical protein [Caldimonas brevitalea]AKJ29065.1 hypothetical protein AAW51_2374 [Caldimonas brevitalea]